MKKRKCKRGRPSSGRTEAVGILVTPKMKKALKKASKRHQISITKVVVAVLDKYL